MNVNHLARQPARSRMRRRFDVPKANQNEINKYDQILPLAQERASMKQDLLNKGLTPKTEMLTIQQQVRHGKSLRATLYALISVATISIPLVPQSVTAAPGMAATVELKTGKRKLIEFLLSPLMRMTNEAGRER